MSTRAITGGWRLLFALSGWIVWAAAFAVLYAVQGYFCHSAATLPDILGLPGLTVLLVVVWLIHLGAIGVLEWKAIGQSRRRPEETGEIVLARLSHIVNVTAALALIWFGAPILVLPPCG
ncbi:hypothetical protein [Lutibaculum baratangense]|uniref:Uncharacterized protein n=1 Tax=Lutibaculum baratangense AMV1 TaxID=631454 RepID=V4T9S8_9HYPH|nr:hypothetical protein [Lutibaculum baratangense]ESR23258.1 hypothetical protein N177_3326 [Lutibaculum baratangense AMV1]